MTPDQIYILAQRLHAALPDTRIKPGEPWEAEAQYQCADTLTTLCQHAGVEDLQSVIIAEAISSYLGGWGGRYGNLDDQVEAARAELNIAAGGLGEALEGLIFPEGERLGTDHIAIMVDWVLSQADLEADDIEPEPERT